MNFTHEVTGTEDIEFIYNLLKRQLRSSNYRKPKKIIVSIKVTHEEVKRT